MVKKKKTFHPIIIFNDTHIFKINMLFLHAVFSGSNAAFSYSLENNLRTLIFTTNSYNRFTRPELQVAVTAELNLLTLTSLVSQLEFFFWWYFFKSTSAFHLHIYTYNTCIGFDSLNCSFPSIEHQRSDDVGCRLFYIGKYKNMSLNFLSVPGSAFVTLKCFKKKTLKWMYL